MVRVKSVVFLIGLLSLPILVLMTFTKPTLAQQVSENTSDVVCEELQEEMKKDKELADLVAKYERLLNSQSLSADELAKLIAEDENEKARLLGVQVVQNSVDAKESELLGICYAPLWRAGRVEWNFSNPGQYGAKYSVKPEASSALVWATPPRQDIDGIYRLYWGSCKAYKIPNGGTATFNNSETWDTCYNAFGCEVLGKCPGWVNPCSMGDWPNSPLS